MGGGRRKQHGTNINNKFAFSRNTIIVIAVLVVIISIVCYFAIRLMIPVNGNSPVLGAPKNNFVKASHIQSPVTSSSVNQLEEQEKISVHLWATR
jgi:type IV secretory pathway component VirB8